MLGAGVYILENNRSSANVNKKHNVNIDSADITGSHVKLTHFPRPPVEATPSTFRVSSFSSKISEEKLMTKKIKGRLPPKCQIVTFLKKISTLKRFAS